jgi:hypothetical protein
MEIGKSRAGDGPGWISSVSRETPNRERRKKEERGEEKKEWWKQMNDKSNILTILGGSGYIHASGGSGRKRKGEVSL